MTMGDNGGMENETQNTEIELSEEPVITLPADRRKTCPAAKFGRPHAWMTGAFYWPLGASPSHLYLGEDFVMCGGCGEIRDDR